MNRSMMVRKKNVIINVPMDELYYAESENRKVLLHTKRELIDYYGRIGELAETLPADFYRIHRSFIVNMKYVRSYSRFEVEMAEGSRLLISKYKYAEFVNAYLRFMDKKSTQML